MTTDEKDEAQDDEVKIANGLAKIYDITHSNLEQARVAVNIVERRNYAKDDDNVIEQLSMIIEDVIITDAVKQIGKMFGGISINELKTMNEKLAIDAAIAQGMEALEEEEEEEEGEEIELDKKDIETIGKRAQEEIIEEDITPDDISLAIGGKKE